MRLGSKVIVRNGRTTGKCRDGDIGKITRVCSEMHHKFVTLKKHAKDPAYSCHEFGPFNDKDLEDLS